EFIDSRLGSYTSGTAMVGIGRVRAYAITQIRTFLLQGRFPTTEEDLFELSLVPFIFQEANYDGIDWGRGTSRYGHLQDLFDLDFYLAFGGRERGEITEAESSAYWDRCHRFIDRRTK